MPGRAPNVGRDLTYGLASHLPLAATLHPDVGQVEADPAQVNLGGFEPSSSERRPFFVEGSDAFSTSPRRFFPMNRAPALHPAHRAQPQRRCFGPGGVSDVAGAEGSVYTA